MYNVPRTSTYIVLLVYLQYSTACIHRAWIVPKSVKGKIGRDPSFFAVVLFGSNPTQPPSPNTATMALPSSHSLSVSPLCVAGKACLTTFL
jgi:hypothetical protein